MGNGAFEANFDGLVGPTHNYAGLSRGNIASRANRGKESNPRAAALQGLEKMRRLAEAGVAQALLPPQDRPDLVWLRKLGFTGDDAAVLYKAAKEEPALLAAAWSASSMWTANAATVSPASDSADGRVHITTANLPSQAHRSLEVGRTASMLKHVFPPGAHFAHHDPLPAGRVFGDEGAANHIRLAPRHGQAGLQVFVYGGRADEGPETRKYPARQSAEASRAVARRHLVDAGRAVFLQQSPKAIDAGVFHNDVISVGNEGFLFCHEAAFRDQKAALREIKRKYAALGQGNLRVTEVKAKQVKLPEAVATYLFNSQILTLPDGGVGILAAEECRLNKKTRKVLEGIGESGLPIKWIEYADLRQSMRNGGGPACLRLRVVLTQEQWDQVATGTKFNAARYVRLKTWVEKHYRDRLSPSDLADPQLVRESRDALDELAGILGLEALYSSLL